MTLAFALVLAASAVALAFRPWAVLVHGSALRVWLEGGTAGSAASAIFPAAWLIAWGEAFLTGALTAIFVAFRPQWLLTYSDERYLPPPVR